MPPLSDLIDQKILSIPQFSLDCGAVLKHVPVAYKTWGELNETKDNVMIICHAFTGSADVEDWWGPMMGNGKAFDPRRFFIFCANTLGSPYGSASPITLNPDTEHAYGPEFPPTTIRDDIRYVTLESFCGRRLTFLVQKPA
jgi:homoserine O-acetyltransferase